MRRHLLLLLLSTAAFAEDGHVVGHVFHPGGLPAEGVRIEAGPAADTTDAQGSFSLRLPEGPWELALDGQRIPATVVGGASTELLITLPGEGGSLQILAETPAARGPVVEQEGVLVPLEGRVVDEEGRPLSHARVFLRGRQAEVLSDAEGRFRFEVPPGTHALSVLRAGHATRSIEGIEVPAEGLQGLQVELVEAGLALADMNVTVPRLEGSTASLLAERQDSADVVDTIGAEEMSRRGDSNAASALRRVTGLTVVGGKYVYVRGLGERYSATLLNGSTLPSPEPDRRVVPLDLFPAAVLEGVVVQKTFSPDVPAEFGGGTVQIRTRGIPDEPLLSLSLSGGWQQYTTGRTGFVADGGPTDWLGLDNGYRDLPDRVLNEEIIEETRFTEGLSPEQIEALGETIPNRWGLSQKKAPPDVGLGLVAGRGFDLWEGGRFGLLGGLTYANGWDHLQYSTTSYSLAGRDLIESSTFRFDEMTNTVQAGGLGVVSLQLSPDHSLQTTVLITRDSEDLAREYIGTKQDFDLLTRVQTMRWVERELFTRQVSGTHAFPFLHDLELDWRSTWSDASRIEPDRRDLVMHPLDEDNLSQGWRLRDGGGNHQILDRDLLDQNTDQGFDIAMPFGSLRPEAEEGFGLRLQAGYNRVYRRRDTEGRRFKYNVASTPGESSDWLYEGEPDEIFVPDRIGPDGFVLADATDVHDSYGARQRIQARYGMVDLIAPWGTRLMGGARIESAYQRIRTYKPFDPDAEVVDTILQTNDTLPAFTVTQPLLKRDAPQAMQIRAGYGKTINRPDLRELSPGFYKESEGGPEVVGNPDLQRALIDNWDLRWEWYPSADESLSVGLFTKRFQDPIETVQIVSTISRVSFANVKEARNQGIEIETRKSLGFGAEPSLLDSIYLSGNISLVRSEVDVGEAAQAATHQRRPLQGQSPWVLNLGLSYESPESWLGAALLYNVAGRRIAQVGEGGLPHTYELPQHEIDAVLSASLGAGWKLRLNGRNLLDQPSRLYLGDSLVEEIYKGRSLSLGLSWTAGERQRERQPHVPETRPE